MAYWLVIQLRNDMPFVVSSDIRNVPCDTMHANLRAQVWDGDTWQQKHGDLPIRARRGITPFSAQRMGECMASAHVPIPKPAGMGLLLQNVMFTTPHTGEARLVRQRGLFDSVFDHHRLVLFKEPPRRR